MEAAIAAAPEMDFSLAALFLRAHWVVQIVMVILIVASFLSWTVIIERWLKLRRARAQTRSFQKAFWASESLDALYDRIGEPSIPAEKVFVTGLKEWRKSFDREGKQIAGSRERIDRLMAVTVAREIEAAGSGLGLLATVGSVSPFIGLFGTVWGIKNSFQAIATEQNTNLAVVAPGIAEALVATALGLLAAIPAVVGYNRLMSDLDKLSGDLENFADEFATILSRQLEKGAG